MKTNYIVEYLGSKVDVKTMDLKFRELWKEEGKLVKDIETLDIYFKPEENKVYYVVNSDTTGSFCL